MKKLLSLLTVAALAVSLTACNSNTASSSSASSAESSSAAISSATSSASGIPTGLTGSLTIAGSSALQPLVKAAAEDLKSKNSDVSITVNAGGSGQGLQNISDKSVDIGNSDIFAKEKITDTAKLSALVDHKVCIVGVGAVVNSEVTVTNLTQQQLVDIFTGKITNWKDVGGSDMKIVIVNRPANSGTRALFKKYALGGVEEATGTALQEDNSGTLMTTVNQTKGAIAYLALSYTIPNSVKTLSLDGVAATYDNIYSGKYKVWGYEHMYTNGDATGLAKSLIDYITSDAFAPSIEKMGYGVTSKLSAQRDN